MKVFITGVTGFAGSHLCDYILREHLSVEIHGLVRWRSPRDNIAHLEGKISLHLGDLHELSCLLQILREVKPDLIFHLAAQSYSMASFRTPADTHHTNVTGTLNVLEAVRLLELPCRVHVASTGDVYGKVADADMPIKETHPLHPTSPYAASKVGAETIARAYALSYGIPVVMSRAFSHTGPRRSEVFADSSFARQAVRMAIGRQQSVKVGNLSSARTFCDVRDMVRAYWLLANGGEAGHSYNIGGEEIWRMDQLLSKVLELAGADARVVVDRALYRPGDVTCQIPDTTEFCTLTGWQAAIPFEQTLRDLVGFWQLRESSKTSETSVDSISANR